MNMRAGIPALEEQSYSPEITVIAREIFNTHNDLSEQYGRMKRVDWDDLSSTARCHWMATVKLLLEARVVVSGPAHIEAMEAAKNRALDLPLKKPEFPANEYGALPKRGS